MGLVAFAFFSLSLASASNGTRKRSGDLISCVDVLDACGVSTATARCAPQTRNTTTPVINPILLIHPQFHHIQRPAIDPSAASNIPKIAAMESVIGKANPN